MPSRDDTRFHAIRAAVEAALPTVISLRHDLHRHPELAFQEERTARVVAEHLAAAGIPHETGVGGTYGIVATVRGTQADSGRTFALRGDMDALPIQEENEVPYKSTVAGKMHACGHDGHTANLLGTALSLHALRDRFAGTVKFLFQPAEEITSGAKKLIAAGAIDDVDAIVMLHGWPTMAVGKIGVRIGPTMASSDSFSLVIQGKGGHGGFPHTTIDPILVGCQVVTALQTLASREISPTNPVVVSVTTFHAGTAKNIIAETAEIGGTVRTLDPELRETMPERIERVAAGVCAALRAGYRFEYRHGTPVTINTAAITELIREAGTAVLGAENVEELPDATMGGEDFAYYLERVPGAMFRLGTGCPSALHTPRYDYGDAPLGVGMMVMTEAALRFLEGNTCTTP
ncbi:MAG: amidohydrolase [Armatimonadaceae bacterium]